MELKIDNPKLNEEIASFLGIDKKGIQQYYQTIKSSYNSNCTNSSEGFIEAEKFKNIQFANAETKRYWERASLIGVDLPLYFESPIKNSKTIVVIGIDPLRKRKDFLSVNTNKVIVGTPYAFHSNYYREKKGRTKIYFDFVYHLVSKGYNVYLTDIFKIWMNDHTKDEKTQFNLSKESTHALQLVQKEFSIIKPKMIIAFGETVEKHCKEFIVNSKKLPKLIKLPHPSGSNNSKWNLLLEGKATCENKIDYLKRTINEKLN